MYSQREYRRNIHRFLHWTLNTTYTFEHVLVHANKIVDIFVAENQNVNYTLFFISFEKINVWNSPSDVGIIKRCLCTTKLWMVATTPEYGGWGFCSNGKEKFHVGIFSILEKHPYIFCCTRGVVFHKKKTR